MRWFLVLLLADPGSALFWNILGYGTGITYQLYTKLNPVNGQPLIYADVNSVYRSNFNKYNPTRLIIHGFGQNGRSNINRDLKNSYLARGNFNVIVSDWSQVSSVYYEYARYRVDTTGIAVSRFIEWMNLNYNILHVVGFGLGAHVAGIAGKNSVKGRIRRIIGLDPAQPLFNEYTTANRLNTGDAQLVEVFHSNGGVLGIFNPIGDINFYINNGKTQPECAATNNQCSHYRSVIVFTRLLTRNNNYITVPCGSIDEVATGCSQDPLEILLEEAFLTNGLYQISTVNAEAVKAGTVKKDVENIDDVETIEVK